MFAQTLSRTAGVADFNGNVSATSLTLNGTSDTTFAGSVSGALSIGGASTVRLNGTSDTARTVGGISTATNNQGTVEVNRGGTGMTTFSGALGTSTHQLEGLTLTAGNTAFTGEIFAQTLSRTAGVADFNGNVSATNLTLNGTSDTTFAGSVSGALSIGGASTVRLDGASDTARTVGGISTTTNNQGAVEVNRGGTGMTTFSGALGAEGNQLEGLTLTAGNTAFTGEIFAQTLSRTAGVADFNGNVSATSLTLNGTSDTTFAGSVSGALSIGGASTVRLDGAGAQTMTGAITAAANNQGTVEVNNTLGSGTAVTFSGALGTSTNRLGGLTLTAGNTAFTGDVFAQTLSRTAGVADFNGNVSATSLTLNGTADTTFAGSVSGALSIGGASTVRLDGTGAQTMTGAITAAMNNQGTLEITNPAGATFSGVVGGNNSLLEINVGSGGTVQGVANFGAAVSAGSVVVRGGDDGSGGEDSVVRFGGDVTTTGG